VASEEWAEWEDSEVLEDLEDSVALEVSEET
jgi:hypothetical protein